MNSNFHLLAKTQRIISYYNKILINFPKTEIVLKNNIEKTAYDMIENIFSFNINDAIRIREKYLKDFLVKLSMYDYYSKISYEKKIISKRQFEVIGRAIIEIRKISYGLIKGERERGKINKDEI